MNELIRLAVLLVPPLMLATGGTMAGILTITQFHGFARRARTYHEQLWSGGKDLGTHYREIRTASPQALDPHHHLLVALLDCYRQNKSKQQLDAALRNTANKIDIHRKLISSDHSLMLAAHMLFLGSIILSSHVVAASVFANQGGMPVTPDAASALAVTLAVAWLYITWSRQKAEAAMSRTLDAFTSDLISVLTRADTET